MLEKGVGKGNFKTAATSLLRSQNVHKIALCYKTRINHVGGAADQFKLVAHA